MAEYSHNGHNDDLGTELQVPEAGHEAALQGGLTDSTLQFLHSLGFIYGAYGQTKRALALQLIAVRIAPENTALLRTLAYTFLRDGAADRTLAVIDRLRSLGDDDPALSLLESRALWALGQQTEAKRIFSEFLERRGQG
jgi:type III secretion protein Y